jgi:FKBP-type peptidyl-prolyl cis-trans isomerase
MSVGARYKFVVSTELTWGKRGIGYKIGPNAALFFDIRLVAAVSD